MLLGVVCEHMAFSVAFTRSVGRSTFDCWCRVQTITEGVFHLSAPHVCTRVTFSPYVAIFSERQASCKLVGARPHPHSASTCHFMSVDSLKKSGFASVTGQRQLFCRVSLEDHIPTFVAATSCTSSNFSTSLSCISTTLSTCQRTRCFRQASQESLVQLLVLALSTCFLSSSMVLRQSSRRCDAAFTRTRLVISHLTDDRSRVESLKTRLVLPVQATRCVFRSRQLLSRARRTTASCRHRQVPLSLHPAPCSAGNTFSGLCED